MDIFNAYRKLFASTNNESVCWWYCGVVSADFEGFGDLPRFQAETVMVFDTKTPAPDTLKITWKEIGYFRNIATGEIADAWHNPFTGINEVRSKSFEDGPAEYTVTRNGDGVDVFLTQSHALIEKVKLVTSTADGRVSFVQTEDKTRTYQRPDGSWPDVNSAEARQVRTVLSIFGDLAEVEDPTTTNVRAAGFYRSGAVKQGTDLRSRSHVKGIMQKAAPDEVLNPIAWHRLKKLYPGFFRGERVDPGWD